MATERTGHCLCGAVRITARNTGQGLHACHCGMCRRWSGLSFVGFGVAEADLTIEDQESVACYASSDWAERCFCRICGSTLWYHLTIPDQEHSHFIAAGLMDDLSGMALETELFIDRKPDAFAFAGETVKTTEADFLASVSAEPQDASPRE